MSGPLDREPNYDDPMAQQALQILECGICSEEYGDDFNHAPRILKCGHTHCTRCLQSMMLAKGVKCPVCSAWHPINRPDVTQLPLNVTVFEILKSRAEQGQRPINLEPLCEACLKNTATLACIDCQPGTPYRFCNACDRLEHERNFGPVRRHRRYQADQVPVLSTFLYCKRHPTNKALYFSESLNEFACGACETASDWSTRNCHFEPVVECSRRLRARLQMLNQNSRDIIGKLTESKLKLEGILYELGPSASAAKTQVSNKFAEIMSQIQTRQQKLLKTVEDECVSRQYCLEQQLKNIQKANKEFNEAHEDVNNLIPKNDFDFLASYRAVVEKVEHLILSEDRSLQRPLAQQDIPFVVSKEVLHSVTSLGAIGGGKTPLDLRVEPTQNKCDLLSICWELPAECGKIANFEIEFEQVHDSLEAVMGTAPSNLWYYQREPRYHKVAGNELKAYVDFLCPGYTYKFKIRSSNAAGWGMWSESVTGECIKFPLTIGYTKRIHRICIPTSAHYRITAMGAKAIDGFKYTGGKGAIISATFSLKAGDILILLCGGTSSKQEYSSGGAGGTFVALNEVTLDNLLIAAGGGGGTRGLDEDDCNGMDASLDVNGTDGQGFEHGKGGINGGPGEDANAANFRGPCWGFGGAGFLKDATSASSFFSGGHGGRCGGFGGGGGVGSWGGGGGGGFSGGGGGRGGGGGGSYVHSDATNPTREVGNEGTGCIIIEKATPPYPLESKSSNLSVWSQSASSVTMSDVAIIKDFIRNPSSGYGTIERPTLESFSSSASSTNGSQGQFPSQTSTQPSSHPNSGEVSQDPSSHHSSPGSTLVISAAPTNSTMRPQKEDPLHPIQEVCTMIDQEELEARPPPSFFPQQQPVTNTQSEPNAVQPISAHLHQQTEAPPRLFQAPSEPPRPVVEIMHQHQEVAYTNPPNVQQLVTRYPFEQDQRELHQSQQPTELLYNNESASTHQNVQSYPIHAVSSEPIMPFSHPSVGQQQQYPVQGQGMPPASTVFNPPQNSGNPNPQQGGGHPSSIHSEPGSQQQPGLQSQQIRNMHTHPPQDRNPNPQQAQGYSYIQPELSVPQSSVQSQAVSGVPSYPPADQNSSVGSQYPPSQP